MRRILDAFSRRDKQQRVQASQPSPAIRVSLPAVAIPHLNDFVTSGNSTCSSDQSSAPLSSDTPPPTKPRALTTWLSIRRRSGRKQSAVATTTEEDTHPLPVQQKTSRSSRSQSQSLSQSRFQSHPANNNPTPQIPLAENLIPEYLHSEKRTSIQTVQSAKSPPPSPRTRPPPPRPALKSPSHSSRFPPEIQNPSSLFHEARESSSDAPVDPPPLLTPHGQAFISFPKSTAFHSRHLSSPSLLSQVHNKALIKRVESSNPPCTLMELGAVTKYRRRRNSTRRDAPEAVLRPGEATLASEGVRRWMARPCFEERCIVYTRNDNNEVEAQPVIGSAVAVAELEYSAHLELLAGSALDNDFEPSQPNHRATEMMPEQQQQPQSQRAPPRIDAGSSQNKRGVRFQTKVEEVEPDDLVPLSVTLEAKKREEEKRRALLLEEEKRIQKVRQQEKAEADRLVRHKIYSAEVTATRERREFQRLGFQPGKRSSMVSSTSTSSQSLASTSDGTFKRPAFDVRRSSSSLQVDDYLRLNTAHSRPASYTSSGEDSPRWFNDRASSSTSLPGVGHSSRSVSSSGDSQHRVRQHSRERSATTPRARAGSLSRGVTPGESIPPVPFLARPWNMPDLAIPPANAMAQGPFLAALRVQGAYIPPPTFYMAGPMNYHLPRTEYQINNLPSGGEGKQQSRRTSTSGPTRSQSIRSQSTRGPR